MNSASGMAQAIPQVADYVRILPEIVLTVFGMIVMVLDPLVGERGSQRTLGAVALIGSLAALLATLFQAHYPGLGFWNMVQVDSFSVFFHFLVAAVTAVTSLSLSVTRTAKLSPAKVSPAPWTLCVARFWVSV